MYYTLAYVNTWYHLVALKAQFPIQWAAAVAEFESMGRREVVSDEVIEGMAKELHGVLLERGLDPKDPPAARYPNAKSSRVYQEYRRRGGTMLDADAMLAALTERVTQI